eukprot:gene11351-biopygen8234
MMRLINIAPTWQDQIVFRLAWMTASRWSEIYALTTDCFLARVCWLGNPYWLQQHADFGLGNDPQNIKRQAVPGVPVRPILRAPSGDAAAITSRSRPRVSVDDHHGPQLRQLMIQLGKRVDPRGGLRHYTAHSIKRGALQSAAVLREEKDLDPEKVVLLAKHSSPTQISSTTLRYLQEYAVHLTGGDTMMALLADMLDV